MPTVFISSSSDLNRPQLMLQADSLSIHAIKIEKLISASGQAEQILLEYHCLLHK